MPDTDALAALHAELTMLEARRRAGECMCNEALGLAARLEQAARNLSHGLDRARTLVGVLDDTNAALVRALATLRADQIAGLQGSPDPAPAARDE